MRVVSRSGSTVLAIVADVDAATPVAPQKESILTMAAETRVTSKMSIRLEQEHV